VGFVITGGVELRGAMKAMAEAADAATRAATATGAHLIEAEIKKKLTTSSHPKGTPTPSAPGEPPSLVSGQLRRSIKVEGPRKLGPGLYQARIGPTAAYGRVQELGGMAGRGRASSLPARPYVAPALKGLVADGRLARAYSDAWRTAMRLG
jgi:phage gpG-like protein